MTQSSNPLSSFLEQALSSVPNHYLWLRSLSYLEYIGYRKMVKAVPYSEVNGGVFHHLSDEIQHSFMLKEVANRSLVVPKMPEAVFEKLVSIAEEYFQGIDSMAHDWVAQKMGKEDSYSCYLWVSFMVEKRAMKVYPQYFSTLTESPIKLVIQKIIKDESEHLSYLENQMKYLPAPLTPEDSFLLTGEEDHFCGYLKKMQDVFINAH